MKQIGKVDTVRTLDDFIGKTFTKVEVVNDDEELVFTMENGTKYIFYHEQDCCESVYVEDVCGDLLNLVGSPLEMAEEVKHERVKGDWGDGYTHTFYKFATRKGYVTVRWVGESNGYYSECVSFRIEEE